ncbi:hypothetical protein StoSoilB13_40300 (plasmid) [Arthrobacter sp. StoSoilB13]|nr:hypothetical protein StoSoilB13_40300 [Arthrobacter sp. StoSoilB13]
MPTGSQRSAKPWITATPRGPDRLLDDLLLWQYGTEHIDLTAEAPDVVPHPRRDSLQRRLKQIERYRQTAL